MIPHEEKLENLLVLLGGNANIATSMSASTMDLPSATELAKELGTEQFCSNDESSINVNEISVVVWLTNGTPEWFIGCVIRIVNQST